MGGAVEKQPRFAHSNRRGSVPQWLIVWVEVECACAWEAPQWAVLGRSKLALQTRSVCECVLALCVFACLHNSRYIWCTGGGVGCSRRKCAAACHWDSNPLHLIHTHTHTYSLNPKLLKCSFLVKKSALANVLLPSKPAGTDALKAPALWGQGAVFIRPQMVSSVSPPTHTHAISSLVIFMTLSSVCRMAILGFEEKISVWPPV